MDERREDYPIIHERLAVLETNQKSVLKKLDVITDEIGKVHENCFARTEDYVLFRKHLQNGERLKGIWQDRNFKIMFGLVSPIYIALIGFIVGCILGK